MGEHLDHAIRTGTYCVQQRSDRWREHQKKASAHMGRRSVRQSRVSMASSSISARSAYPVHIRPMTLVVSRAGEAFG